MVATDTGPSSRDGDPGPVLDSASLIGLTLAHAICFDPRQSHSSCHRLTNQTDDSNARQPIIGRAGRVLIACCI